MLWFLSKFEIITADVAVKQQAFLYAFLSIFNSFEGAVKW